MGIRKLAVNKVKNWINPSGKTAKEKLDICNTCDDYNKESKRCKICGCFMEVKTRTPGMSCPVGKW
jgi:recombinational DNA repair protein RecR